MITRQTAFITILCAFALTACATQQQMPEQVEETATTVTRADVLQMDTRFLYLASQDAVKDGNLELAIELLSVLVEKDAAAITPHIQLAALLLQTGRQVEAEQHITALLAEPALSNDQREELQLTRIRMLVSRGKMEEALALLDTLLKTQPAHLMAREMQARILANQERMDEALRAIKAAISAEDLPEFRLLQAQLFIKKNDLIQAKVSLQRMLQLEPDSDMAAIMLSGIALKQNKPEEAEDTLRQFLATHNEAPNVSHSLGKLLIEQNRIVEAIIVYRDADSASGGNSDILKSLGMLYFRHQDFDKAAETFARLVQEEPTDHVRFYYAASLEALQKTQQAREVYESINPAGPMGMEAQVRLASIEFGENKLKQAEKRLLNVVKLQPDQMEAQLMLTGLWLAQEQFQKLLSETEALLDNSNIHPQILFNRAVAFEHLKQYDNVETMLMRVLAKNPKYSEALNFLGYTYAIQNINLDKAETLIKRALQEKPNDGYYLDSLAWVYFQGGDYVKALATQKQALESISNDAVMFEHYGDILWKNGQLEPAREAWQKAIDLNAVNSKQLKNKISGGPDANQ
ncbi:MAG: hypothetical protein CO187_00320 [Zetaproteobacteria bacterium CG_4_9_14_3_um_filter_53_7]|nr:MAG: hypothetical protein CO187_00320 [Zetaproteobacteria bacterium CG_4_9_14_3_um_filter_53_7]